MTGEAYKQSALLAEQLGAFKGYRDARCAHVKKPVAQDNVNSMLQVIELHRAAVKNLRVPETFRKLQQTEEQCWDQALALGREHG